jgi:phosphonate transport system permease protein
VSLSASDQARPGVAWRSVAIVLALVLLSIWALPIDLTAVSSVAEWTAAVGRLGEYLSAFASPDLSSTMLTRCVALAVDTVAVALLGTALGLLLAYPIAIGACRAIVLADRKVGGMSGRVAWVFMEAHRLLLDAMRGVPDFVWAVLLANITGVSPITGMLAIAISVAGIFGKVLSEQWDNVPVERYEAMRSTGAGRLATFLYGLQPLGARATMSFVLMRTECAVRNASVIGVVGGGGLGAGLWDEYIDGNWSGVATVLLTLLGVTASADLAANFVRRRLRIDPNHPRTFKPISREAAAHRRLQVVVAVCVILLLCAAWLLDPILVALNEVFRVEWQFVGPYTLGLFQPDLSPETLWSVLRASAVPLAIGVLATVIGGLLAVFLVYPASVAFQLDSARFSGEAQPALVKSVRVFMFVLARAIALVLRGIPEVAWLVMLAVFFRAGVTPCVAAVSLHTAGVLHRVFTESVDDVRYQGLERVSGNRIQKFVYGALPRAWPNWRTYCFFQFEVNMRIGVALGIVGAGGLGYLFKSNLDSREHGQAAAYLWGMILLTIVVDRLSRWLQLKRLRC